MTKKRQFCPRGHDTFQFGRDAAKKCLKCKAEDAAAKVAAQERAVAEARSAFELRRQERDRRLEREYQAAIKRGGHDAAEARWDRASTQMLVETGSRFELCQWEDEIEGEYTHVCYRRTQDVYCGVHNRQLERELAKEAKDEQATGR